MIDATAKTQGAYVYFMLHVEEARLKIGKAVNLKQRWQQLGNEFDFANSFVSLCESEEAAFMLERSLHKTFQSARIKMTHKFSGSTEWFHDHIIDELKALVPNAQPINLKELPPFKHVSIRDHSVEKMIHWEFDLLKLVEKTASQCSIYIQGDHIAIEGENCEAFAKEFFHFSIEWSNTSDTHFSRVVSGYCPPDMKDSSPYASIRYVDKHAMKIFESFAKQEIPSYIEF